MSEVARTYTGVAVSMTDIASRHYLTDAQVELMDTLKRCARLSMPFTREDMVRCYVLAAQPFSHYDYATGKWVSLPASDYRVRSRAEHHAYNWLQRNLGACIMKGRLLAIPVMQV